MHDLGIFEQKCLILVTLGKNFRKLIVIFEISILNFVYLQDFEKKTKMPRLETKNAWFGYFCTGIWKQYCHISNHHQQICQNAKFFWKTEMPKLGSMMPFLGIFDQKCLIWVIWSRLLKILMSYLTSAPWILPNCKIFQKKKNT